MARGMVVERNAKREVRTEGIRRARLMCQLETARQTCDTRHASTEELSHQQRYRQALQLERKKIYLEQTRLLHKQLQRETATREFRECVQVKLGRWLQVEAKRQHTSVLQAMRERLDQMARVN